VLWLVPGLAFTKYRCEFGTQFCIYAIFLYLCLYVLIDVIYKFVSLLFVRVYSIFMAD